MHHIKRSEHFHKSPVWRLDFDRVSKNMLSPWIFERSPVKNDTFSNVKLKPKAQLNVQKWNSL